MWLQSCSLVSAILKMMVWNSVGETRPEAGGGNSGLRPPVDRVQNDITVFELTKRRVLRARYGRAKTAKDDANHFQKQDLYPR